MLPFFFLVLTKFTGKKSSVLILKETNKQINKIRVKKERKKFNPHNKLGVSEKTDIIL